MITVECAPKLGHIYFDPLRLEAAKLNGNINIMKRPNPAAVIQKENTSQPSKSFPTESEKSEKLLITNTDKQTVACNKDNEAIVTLEHTKPDMNADDLNSNRSLVLDGIFSDINLSSDWLDPETERNSTDSSEQLDPGIKYIEHEHEGQTANPISAQKSQVTNKDTKLAVGINDLNPINEQNLDSTLETTTPTTFKALLRKKESSKREIIRSAAGSQEYKKNTKKLCAGYDYDVTICRYFGKRYLCGCDKNVGNLKESEEIEDLGNGCRMRGDRMECGYDHGPFEHHHNSQGENVQKLIMLNPASLLDRNTNDNTQSSASPTVNESNHAQSMQAIQISDIAKLENTKNPNYSSKKRNVVQPKKVCAEKDNRLVCYDIPA